MTVSPAEKLHLEIKADMKIFDGADICQMYEDETWDMVTLRIRALDQNGNLAPYCNDVLHFEAEGVSLHQRSFQYSDGGRHGRMLCMYKRARKAKESCIYIAENRKWKREFSR